MKVLFLNEKFGYWGGVEQCIVDAAFGLRARGHSCYLAYGNSTERDTQGFASYFEAVFPCRQLCNSAHPPLGALPFSEIVAKVMPDVLFLHRMDETAFLEPHLSKVRIVRMVHDHDLCCPRRHKYFALTGRICRHKADWRCWLDGAFLARNETSRIGFRWVSIGRKLTEMRRNYRWDRLLVASRFMRDELAQNGFPQERIHILPWVARLKPCPFTPVPNGRRILYVGQLIRGKGVDLLLHALRKLRCDFEAMLIGTGNAQSRLQTLCARLDLSQKVRFVGWIDHEEISTYYVAARFLVVPSRWPEPFGMIGQEAMHHGRPVVAFDVGGISDWLEHNMTGLLVPEQDVSALADAMERLLRDDDLATTMGRNAYELVRRRYVFDRYIEQLELHLLGDALPPTKS